MIFSEARYGVALSFDAPVEKAGSDDFAASADWTPATGDVKISKDGGTAANIGTLPSFISGMNSLKWTLSAAEMEASRIAIVVVDSATKVIKDVQFNGTTELNGRILVTIAGTPTATSMDTDLTDATGIHDDSILKFIKSTNLKNAQAIAQTFTNTNGVLTFSAGDLPAAPASGDLAMIINR